MMNSCSSVPDFAKPYVIHEESLVADELFGEISHVTRLCLKLELMFIYGSLSRPPEAHHEAGFCTRHNDMEQISTILHNSSGLGYFTCLFNMWNQALECKYVVGDFVVWHTLASRYVHRQGELWLEQFRQNHACGIVDILCDLVEVGMICIIALPTFCRDVVAMLLMIFGGLRVIAPHIDGLYANQILQSVLKSHDPVNHSLVIGFRRMDKLSPLLIVDGK
ncbi:hypothetical protein AALP_AAs73017U000200 [Arabis alpina]|uniref:Uncharacterized protein n=1 Tax=Arabis alpina TaxID=50452 RepID=A0A087FZ01_ARAAL|nr:hypothetical protein AALP_AAs73017U000200 [Arabis alpina]